MSQGETVAERIENVRKSLPPTVGRKSRNPYPSKDDFASILGAARQLVIDWTIHGVEPSGEYRRKLAALSSGRYQPDDFMTRRETQRLAARVGSLERSLRRVEARADRILALNEANFLEIAKRFDRLEHRLDALVGQDGGQSHGAA